MKALVTGGAGFIGSHLVEELLLNNIDVIVIDNFSTGRVENLSHVERNLKLINADISEIGLWECHFKEIDWVFHLAALADIVPSIQNPEDYFRSNVIGTYNVISAARKFDVKKLIYAASSSCYGIPNNYPTNELSEIRPQYPYALTKRIGEELVMHWSKVYGMNAISLRFFNVYGTRSRTSGTYGAVLGVFLAQKLSGKPFTVVGDGNQTRDFTYVSDVVNALIVAAKSNISGNEYNVGSGKTISINYLTNLIGGEKVYIPKRPGEPEITFADIHKIKTDLGWEPKISIEDGIKKVIEHIDYWESAPVWTPETIEIETRDWFRYLKKNS